LDTRQVPQLLQDIFPHNLTFAFFWKMLRNFFPPNALGETPTPLKILSFGLTTGCPSPSPIRQAQTQTMEKKMKILTFEEETSAFYLTFYRKSIKKPAYN
jgi:hypothetical protein